MLTKAIPQTARSAAALKIHKPDAEPVPLDDETNWKVNGWPLIARIWSAEEWERLENKPAATMEDRRGNRLELRMA